LQLARNKKGSYIRETRSGSSLGGHSIERRKNFARGVPTQFKEGKGGLSPLSVRDRGGKKGHVPYYLKKEGETMGKHLYWCNRRVLIP